MTDKLLREKQRIQKHQKVRPFYVEEIVVKRTIRGRDFILFDTKRITVRESPEAK